jgi:hypothetical protein
MKARCAIAMILVCALHSASAGELAANGFVTEEAPQLWLPDLVSTPASEVRITFSPDAQRMLWGTIGWPKSTNGGAGWDIYESRRTPTGWSRPEPVTFNSDANDFDPSFAPDGSGVYFFSNRSGGFGKDDLYFAQFNPSTNRYSAAVNLGSSINTAGDEWAPVMSTDRKRLLFASAGHGGKGKHDLFVAERDGTKWRPPVNLAEVNSAQEDFDATYLEDGRSIVFSRGDMDGAVVLYLAEFRDGKLQAPVRLPAAINSTEPDAWTFGPSIAHQEPFVLYFTSHHAENRGRADIYKIKYSLPGYSLGTPGKD